ncbi:hypothetical protein CF327_g7207 [Tilletia walkeri]|nr:hypothetical protein CF327_g7207 [Tilletia walkeri]
MHCKYDDDCPSHGRCGTASDIRTDGTSLKGRCLVVGGYACSDDANCQSGSCSNGLCKRDSILGLPSPQDDNCGGNLRQVGRVYRPATELPDGTIAISPMRWWLYTCGYNDINNQLRLRTALAKGKPGAAVCIKVHIGERAAPSRRRKARSTDRGADQGYFSRPVFLSSVDVRRHGRMDSMALAYLESELRSAQSPGGEMDILDSPHQDHPSKPARRLALLHFLRSHRLQTVLSGHHADDQYETAELRAMNGSCDGEKGFDGLMRTVDGFGAHALLASLEKGHGRDWLAMTPSDREDPTNEVTDLNARNLVRALLRRVEQGSEGSGEVQAGADSGRWERPPYGYEDPPLPRHVHLRLLR